VRLNRGRRTLLVLLRMTQLAARQSP
jgi:hypothetical protein